MKRSFLKTGDGSLTIHLSQWDEQYHSKHGAIAEAKHVFLKEGVAFYCAHNPEVSPVRILEIGFGTGLNCFLTNIWAREHNLKVRYTGVEKFPVVATEVSQLNYAQQLDAALKEFESLHTAPWESWQEISKNLALFKHQNDFEKLDYDANFDLIYFDAFGPRVQPELWSEAIFKKMFKALAPNGVLVTYSAKGEVRRTLKNVGFTVERLPGPPFKRHMLRGVKA
ncbi:MAG: tRNA (5-methylaminomethyl-2-thiouridine)(34)-methyltransferase MnmD [Gilvibacter sp.]